MPIISNKDLFDCWISAGPRDKYSILKSFVQNKVGKRLDNDVVNEKVRLFLYKLSIKWKECSYNKNFFIKKNSSWLRNTAIDFPDPVDVSNNKLIL